MEEGDCAQDIAILGNDDDVLGIAKQKKESHPTKQKVKAFKNRIFSLVLLFVEKAKNVSPLLEVMNQDLFMKESDKMRQLLSVLLNRGVLEQEKLKQIAGYYKNLLLFRVKKDSHKFGEDFIKILRKLKKQDQNQAKNIVQEMLEVFLSKRKCKIQFGFFHFLLKKQPYLKAAIIQKCLSIQQNIKLRPTQLRVLQKLKNSLLRKQTVKEQVQQIEEQQ